ncbi:hypothetical protein CEXT_507881 [Caerostris extrusa]|uniref:Uncharacterized protein n=1 Tax=Caerostris extrusa TaxID=172846 RepID=A0AAV4XAS9_CAEEX|nr:hypothetical protein CEXT_507881 [Caerostris extrusa]
MRNAYASCRRFKSVPATLVISNFIKPTLQKRVHPASNEHVLIRNRLHFATLLTATSTNEGTGHRTRLSSLLEIEQRVDLHQYSMAASPPQSKTGPIRDKTNDSAGLAN